jgi:hypothetical protein
MTSHLPSPLFCYASHSWFPHVKRILLHGAAQKENADGENSALPVEPEPQIDYSAKETDFGFRSVAGLDLLSAFSCSNCRCIPLPRARCVSCDQLPHYQLPFELGFFSPDS